MSILNVILTAIIFFGLFTLADSKSVHVRYLSIVLSSVVGMIFLFVILCNML
jgi:hypothetical protein